MNPALLSSENMNFRTPPEFLKVIEPFGRIVLDPSTDDDNPCGAVYVLTTGGLTTPWMTFAAGGLTYSNPPYGRHLSGWSKKFVEEGEKGCELLTLTPARIDTVWFKRMRKSAAAVCLLYSRIKFWSQVPAEAVGTPRRIKVAGHRRLQTVHFNPCDVGKWLPGAWNKKKNVWSNAAAPFPCAVMYWGGRVPLFEEVFADRGWVILK